MTSTRATPRPRRSRHTTWGAPCSLAASPSCWAATVAASTRYALASCATRSAHYPRAVAAMPTKPT
eukprot:483938-Prymnesium_polylepis.1